MNELKIDVVNLKSRKHLVFRWKDPVTGQDRQETTGKTRRRDAERMIPDQVEKILREAKYGQATWDGFCDRYEAERLGHLSRKYRANWRTASRKLEEAVNPKMLSDVTSSAVSRFTSHLLSNVESVASVVSYLKTIRAAMRWAVDLDLIETAPRFVMPKVPKSEMMRGRPITEEEFERMLKAARKVVNGRAKSWQFLLRGLWLSGLRLQDALDLSWDDTDRLHVVRIDKRRPMVQVPKNRDKSKRERMLPITPDFVAFLREVKQCDRKGQVFQPMLKTMPCTKVDAASKIISKIGAAAKVVIKKQGEKTKYATAHDLRRSFAVRWKSLGIDIDDLTTLLRHESFETTRAFYLGENAHRTADAVWDAFGARETVQKRYTRKSKR